MQTSSTERTLSGNALAFEETTEVSAPVAEVYRKWTDFSRFPEFMEGVEAVRPLGGGRYHWVARILGTKQEWDAEVTDQQENQRISWRSLNGVSNAGTVTLHPLPNNRTRVHLRMEYTPPGGAMGQKLEKMTQITRRQVRNDLENFRRLVSGERRLGREAEMPGAGKVVSALAIPLATGAIGGAVSYLIERKRRPIKARLPGKVADPVSQEAAIAGYVLTGASIASVVTSAIFRARGDRTNALFVGQWAPTFLGAGIMARMFGHRFVNPSRPASVISWALAGASAGSILGSILTHLRTHRHDGLFVGEWAPTFLGAALLTRLITRR
jgi:uncharacterized membrane protein